MRGVGHVVDSSAVSPHFLQSFAQAAPAASVISQLALTLAIAIGGMWAIVNLPRTSEELVAPAAGPSGQGARATQETGVYRLIDPMPQPAVVFMVGSAQAGIDLKKVLELDAIVRASTHQPALDAWVAVVESDEHARTVQSAARELTFQEGVVAALEVIDLR